MAFCLLTHHFGKKQRYGKIGTLGYVYLTDCYEDTRATIVAHPVGIVFFAPVRFAVRYLDWTEIPEDLTPKKSSRAVNRAIVDLNTGRDDEM
uniref:Uncharacterized protein n=1 Tax=Wuchereria bancrofti TaxID=6293 RepID=A0AAF5PYZ3_WUCBA